MEETIGLSLPPAVESRGSLLLLALEHLLLSLAVEETRGSLLLPVVELKGSLLLPAEGEGPPLPPAIEEKADPVACCEGEDHHYHLLWRRRSPL